MRFITLALFALTLALTGVCIAASATFFVAERDALSLVSALMVVPVWAVMGHLAERA